MTSGYSYRAASYVLTFDLLSMVCFHIHSQWKGTRLVSKNIPFQTNFPYHFLHTAVGVCVCVCTALLMELKAHSAHTTTSCSGVKVLLNFLSVVSTIGEKTDLCVSYSAYTEILPT